MKLSVRESLCPLRGGGKSAGAGGIDGIGGGGGDVSLQCDHGGLPMVAEILTFMDMKIPIVYTVKIASADEIKFTRVVGEFATEELVAKRVK